MKEWVSACPNHLKLRQSGSTATLRRSVSLSDDQLVGPQLGFRPTSSDMCLVFLAKDLDNCNSSFTLRGPHRELGGPQRELGGH